MQRGPGGRRDRREAPSGRKAAEAPKGFEGLHVEAHGALGQPCEARARLACTGTWWGAGSATFT